MFMNWIVIRRYEELQTDEKCFRKLTGLNKDEFSALYHFFKDEWHSYFSNFTFNGSPRLRRQVFTRKNSIFGDSQDVLLFSLIYLRGGVPQEQLAVGFGIDQPKASKYLSLTQKILLQVVEKNPNVISKRKQKRISDAILLRINNQFVS